MKKLLLASLVFSLVGMSVAAQEDKPIVSRSATQKYAAIPGVPDCVTLAVLRGDPGKGPSVVEMKLTAGCLVPWHWHSGAEGVVPLSGLLEVTMKDAKPTLFANGDYGYLPGKHIHQAKCSGSKPCSAVFVLDTAFDIHYVDKSGSEIPAEKALAEAEKLMTKQGAKPAPKP